jgi:hypothetical protein
MKRILPLFCMLLLCIPAAFADNSDQGDQYDDGSAYEYKMNGAGDQYIQISLMPSFPLNFEGQLYIGGAAQLGYRRFLTNWLAVGGDAMVGYNPTLGSNILNYWPVTACVMFQPSIWRLEFPISLGAGIAFETYQSRKYFPGFVLKPEVGIFYRFSESWSFGIGSSFLWLPEWYSDSKYNFDGLFMTASLSARYHF